MRPKDEKKQKAIRTTVLKIVLESGISGLRMADIAKRAEISPATLYVYYESKEHLLNSLFQDIYRERIDFAKRKTDPELPYKPRLRQVWISSVKNNLEKVDELYFLEQMKRSHYFSNDLSKARQDKRHFLQDVLNEGKRLQLIKEIDNTILTTVFFSSIRHTVELISNDEVSLETDNTNLLFSMLWDSIRA